MSRRIYIFLIFILGCALLPSTALACGAGSEKCCGKDQTAQKSDTKNCCKKNNQSKGKDECGGKCGGKSCQCQCQISSFSLMSSFGFEISSFAFDFSDEKQKFCHVATYLSSGFYSIWTPPNIG